MARKSLNSNALSVEEHCRCGVLVEATPTLHTVCTRWTLRHYTAKSNTSDHLPSTICTSNAVSCI
eukprot:1837318-Rhodomonas_salina.1